jgi:hypothetical protein
MMEHVVSEDVDLELLVVPACRNAPAAREMLRAALVAAGRPDTGIRVSVIESQREAEERGFVDSPTILINGVDPFAEPGRPPALACRRYPGAAGPSALPFAEELTKALAHPRPPSGSETR